MKRQNFFKKIYKIEKIWEDYTFSKCETTKDKLNWKQWHTEVLDTTRVFFFSGSNTVVLIDRVNGYRKQFKNPTLAINEIKSWLDTLIQDTEYNNSLREYYS